MHLSIPELEVLLEKRLKEAIEAGERWARGKSAYDDLEDKKKPFLAAYASGGEGSNAEKERYALASKDYRDFLAGLSVARKEFLQSLVQYDMAKLRIDVLRTVISARKEEVRQFRG